MKKLILAMAMMIGIVSFSNAQSKVDSASKKHVTKKAMAAKPSAATATVPAKTSPGVVLKKDGTPDKRYNNAAAKARGPLKKDSTPDLRYKANKKP